MPAVYLAAIIALAIDHKGQQLIQMSIHLSTGAIVGIVSCIVTVSLLQFLLVRKIIEVEQYLQFLLVCDFCCDFLSQTYI